MLLSLNLPTPVFPMFRHRNVALGIWGLATLQLSLFLIGLPGWQCPFLHAFGIPCPGCGLTRAIAYLIRGDLQASISFHAFAPVFLAGVVFAAICGLLPHEKREPLVHALENIDRRTGITVIILIGLVLYWLVRLLLFPTEFVQLIRG